MIFLDTSGIIALAMEVDSFHCQAFEKMQSAESAGERILVHSYILVEAAALVQRRIGTDASLLFLRRATSFDIVWVDSHLHAQAVEYQAQNRTPKLSFVDVVSFLVMRSKGVTDFIGFDKHFIEAGFRQYGSQETDSET